MKWQMAIIGLVLASCLMPQAFAGDHHKSTGLIGDWHFDEGTGTTAYDSSGNNNTGTLSGTVWNSTGCPAFNCTTLDGLDDDIFISIAVQDNESFDIDSNRSLTCMIWVDAPADISGGVGSLRMIFNKGDTNNNRWFLRASKTNGLLRFEVDDGIVEDNVDSTTDIRGQGYTHVAMVLNHASGRMLMYINGSEDGNETYSGENVSNADNLIIGDAGAVPDNGRSWLGNLDEARCFDEALNASQISEEMIRNSTSSFIWQFWTQNSDTSDYIQNFSLTFSNGTNEFFRNINSFNLTVNATELPQGNNTVTVQASGFGTEIFTMDVNNTQELNRTFVLDPAALTINLIDELTNSQMPNPIVINIVNTTHQFKGGALNRYIENNGNSVTPEAACDRNISSSTFAFTFTVEVNVTCWVALDNQTSTIFYTYRRAAGGAGSPNIILYLYAFNTNTNQYDLLETQSVPWTVGGQTLTGSFELSNSNGFYNGMVYLYEDNLGTGSDFELFEIYADQLVNAEYSYTEIPNANPATITIKDIEALNEYELRGYFVTVNQFTATTLNAYMIRDYQSTSAPFSVVDSFKVPLSGVLITAQRNFGSGFVTVAQDMTEDSGLAAIPLDPTYTYRMIFSKEGFPTQTLSLKPNFATTKLITMPITISTNFTNVFSDVKYTLTPFEPGLTSEDPVVNFTLEVISSEGSLELFKMNISNSTDLLFTQTTIGSPSGGTITSLINITGMSGTITVGTEFAVANDSATLFRSYSIMNIQEGNYTLNRIIERSNAQEYDLTDIAKATMGIFLLAVIMGSMATLGAGSEVVGVAGIAVLILLGLFGIFGFGLVLVIGLTIASMMYLKWRV